jgi:hypothetical protein
MTSGVRCVVQVFFEPHARPRENARFELVQTEFSYFAGFCEALEVRGAHLRRGAAEPLGRRARRPKGLRSGAHCLPRHGGHADAAAHVAPRRGRVAPCRRTSRPAVMQRRHEAAASLDDFPTPPWATRALCEWLKPQLLDGDACREPACGRGDMVRPLAEYFARVDAADVHDYPSRPPRTLRRRAPAREGAARRGRRPEHVDDLYPSRLRRHQPRQGAS